MLLLCCLLLSGCGASQPIGKRAMVKLITVKCSPAQYEVGLLFLTSNADTDTGSAESIPHDAWGTGETICEAMANAEAASGREPFYAQNELLLIEGAPRRAELEALIAFFSEENFSRTNMAVFCCERLPQKSKLSALSLELEAYTEQSGVVLRRIYDFSPEKTALIPVVEVRSEPIVQTGLWVAPPEGEGFGLTDGADFAALLLGDSHEYQFQTKEASCKVEDIAITHEVRKAPAFTQQLTLRGAIRSVEGNLEEKALLDAVQQEFQAQFNQLYAACYLANETDLFAFDWWFSCYDRRSFSAAKQAGRFYQSETVTLALRLSVQ